MVRMVPMIPWSESTALGALGPNDPNCLRQQIWDDPTLVHWSQWSESTNHIGALLNSIHHINETRYQALPPSYVYSIASSVSSIILSLLLSNLVPKTNLAKIKMSFSQSSASWKIAAKLNTFDQILVNSVNSTPARALFEANALKPLTLQMKPLSIK